MDEYLEVLIRLLEGKTINFSESSINSEVSNWNFPLQKPRPQIWIGAWKRKAIERAAEFAIGGFQAKLRILNI